MGRRRLRNIDSLPSAESFAHGTRARYVTGCRCRPCKDANVAAYHEREARSKAAAADLSFPPVPVEKSWTGPDGTVRTRVYKNGCPGHDGRGCPHKAHLRKDSCGVCARCRLRLADNSLVDAAAARRHLRMLSKRGVGRYSVHAATDVATSIIDLIRTGKRRQIRRRTEQLILAVDETCVADGAYVDATDVWRMVERLVNFHGYTKAAISKRIGQSGRALQLGKRRVTARNALAIRKMLADADGDFL